MALPPFQRFYEDHRDAVYRYLVASLGRADADDCFQETFVAALRAYGDLPVSTNLQAWVFTIAKRKAIDARRRSARSATPVADPPAVAGRAATTVAEDGLDVWAAVRTLPERQRVAIVLRFANDLRYAEIGVIMGCTPEAARRSVHEGLKRLRAREVTP